MNSFYYFTANLKTNLFKNKNIKQFFLFNNKNYIILDNKDSIKNYYYEK